MSLLSLSKDKLATILTDALHRYPETLPSTLEDLDAIRYNTIPDAIRDRQPSPHITSPELVQLVEWKLKHGKFRPSLLKLAKENTDDKVEATTAAAFAHLSKASNDREPPWRSLELAMSDVVELRGIGPATASLVLSCFDAEGVPFFSDELYRMVHWSEEPTKGKEQGWERKMGYTLKEYRGLVLKVSEWREVLEGWSCVDLEKAAWVLGKEAVDLGRLAEQEEVDGDDEQAKSKQSAQGGAKKKEKKRKRTTEAEEDTSKEQSKSKRARQGQGSDRDRDDDSIKQAMENIAKKHEDQVAKHKSRMTKDTSTWNPPMVKKTAKERAISKVGAKAPAVEDFEKSCKRHDKVLAGGRDGAPVKDELGYTLSFDALARSRRRPSKSRSAAKSLAMMEKDNDDSDRKAEIMGVDPAKVSAVKADAFEDVIARDLDIPFHTVDMAAFEEWHRRGHRCEQGMWDMWKPDEEEKARLDKLSSGSVFRVGYRGRD